ncbi:hypothetical protein T440DRAFT_482832 [Plenodomus tracheiphilus IPT5]|uniref:Uncharacterized protein n=1 Tax=Plenodomus tracheiphilus IPT5 TaxID=1408161 RepID=A0A6A7ASQ6_9PLEO|nr:hypothetical protein T440DRAFT_482832 [Plenodomus tracheiphilus IPT5]
MSNTLPTVYILILEASPPLFLNTTTATPNPPPWNPRTFTYHDNLLSYPLFSTLITRPNPFVNYEAASVSYNNNTTNINVNKSADPSTEAGMWTIPDDSGVALLLTVPIACFNAVFSAAVAAAASTTHEGNHTAVVIPGIDGPSDSHSGYLPESPSAGQRRPSAPISSSTSANVFNAALGAYLGTDLVEVSVAAEREGSNPDPNRPAFLKGIVFNPNNEDEWYKQVLPHVTTFTFFIASTSDIFFAGSMLRSLQLHQVHRAITKVSFPGFHWFSGISEDREDNPFLKSTTNLPQLTDTPCQFTLPASTLQAGVDIARSQECSVMDLSEIIDK